MRSDPFSDAWLFLIGGQPDQLALGVWRWLAVALFAGLLVASFVIARENWRRDVSQRTATHVTTWGFRVLMGTMWFQGSLWKLPLPISGGFKSWTEQVAENAAFAFHRDLVRDVLLPNLALLQGATFAAELLMAISLILGFAVRLSSVLGIAFVLQLWLGLYHLPAEWPWLFMFMTIVLGLFAVHGAGRSLGLDALLRHDDVAHQTGRFARRDAAMS